MNPKIKYYKHVAFVIFYTEGFKSGFQTNEHRDFPLVLIM